MPFVILLVAVFNAAQRAALRPALVAGALGMAAIWLEIALTDSDVANYAFTGFFVVAAWIARPRVPDARARRGGGGARRGGRGARRGSRASCTTWSRTT